MRRWREGGGAEGGWRGENGGERSERVRSSIDVKTTSRQKKTTTFLQKTTSKNPGKVVKTTTEMWQQVVFFGISRAKRAKNFFDAFFWEFFLKFRARSARKNFLRRFLGIFCQISRAKRAKNFFWTFFRKRRLVKFSKRSSQKLDDE